MDLGFGFYPNAQQRDLVEYSGSITSPTPFQNLPPTFPVEPNIGSFDDNLLSQHNLPPSFSNLHAFNLDPSIKDPPPCSITDPMDGYRSMYPWYQKSQVHGFLDLPSSHPGQLLPQSYDPYTNQYLTDQEFYESHNPKVKAKHAPGFFCNELGNKFHCSSSNANANVWFVQESIPNEDVDISSSGNSGFIHAPMTLPLVVVDGLPCFETRTMKKCRGFEGGIGRGEEKKMMRHGIHQCSLCNMSFSTGNALGGHMSYHSKQRKLEEQQATQRPKQPPDSELTFACALDSGLQDSVNLSLNSFGW